MSETCVEIKPKTRDHVCLRYLEFFFSPSELSFASILSLCFIDSTVRLCVDNQVTLTVYSGKENTVRSLGSILSRISVFFSRDFYSPSPAVSSSETRAPVLPPGSLERLSEDDCGTNKDDCGHSGPARSLISVIVPAATPFFAVGLSASGNPRRISLRYERATPLLRPIKKIYKQ